MTQSTGGLSFVDAEIRISTDGNSYSDISGFANPLTVSGGERNFGEFFTADGDTPVLKAGKRGSLNVAVVILYTEGTGDPTELLRGYYEAAGGTGVYIDWSPKGGDATEFRYETSVGVLLTPTYPSGDPESGDPVELEFSIQVASIAKAVIGA